MCLRSDFFVLRVGGPFSPPGKTVCGVETEDGLPKVDESEKEVGEIEGGDEVV